MHEVWACVRRALHWLAIATTLLGVVALVVLAFNMAGAIGYFLAALPILAWAVAPFAFALQRLRCSTGSAVRSIGLTVASGVGLGAYSEMLFFTERHSSTEALVFVVIPLYQLLGCGLVVAFTKDRESDDGGTV
jgi:hypothetical protein